ncbi:MAG: MATE family efflux transporter [Treponema sp.]|nr:MATE family efflux transporter [Treponema sp.]
METSADSSAQKSEKFLRMTTMPVEKLVLSLAWPTIAIMMSTSFYNMSASYFVSFLGTSPVAAVGIAFPLMTIVQAIGFFFGQGSGNFISRALGARDTENASRMAATALVSGFFIMSIIAGLGITFLEPLTGILGATETIKPYAMEYLFFILLASPWMVAATVLNQQLRFQGSAAIAMAGMLSGNILNIALTPLFIFTLELGIRGAAIATMVCQILSFVILLLYSTTRTGNIRIRFSHFSPALSRYFEMFRGGVPSLVRQGLLSVATIAIYNFARPHGDAAIAAISISSRITMFANSFVLGFGQGFQPVCGFNFGAKLYSRVRKAFWFVVRTGFITLAVISIALAFFAPQIITLFRDDPEVVMIGVRSLRLHCLSLPFAAAILMVNMLTQTMGRAFESSFIALSRQGLFLILGLIIFNNFFGLLGIQMAVPFADLASLIIVIPIVIRVMRILSVPDGSS